ncbi:maltose excess protein 1-like, chloroplastic [Andrographis paniculata]|uniref:maltose excess protein 1-like, chloroplastic n=1 Tax=Andrographis paniculata TaxID=175694 RepID=UPI0021E83BCE|nr:maltose excess protein 1-like, chloroplastic [Andrographis paniculata]XP_051129590.1 maltose excess protein 1-like, chloroplastic [Andrographis paniculata]XP_051129591.1 maltose excess protein 1-like, chloroplastic [Andrographis paniculata]XP_051129592.1 maltose excess protein 1-like, chloroplastic [Andrographis paniculata]
MGGSLWLLGGFPLNTYQVSDRFSFCSSQKRLESVSCSQINLRRSFTDKHHLKASHFSGQSVCFHRLKTVSCLSSEDANPISQEPAHSQRGESFEQWDSMTAKFAGAANVPFLLLQLPQIILNTRNLLAGNKSALLAVPWLGMLTGLLGNLSLSLYFLKKMEIEAMVVQTVGVISTYIVLLQLAMGEAMPLPQFIVVSIVVAFGLILNFMKYFRLLNEEIWHIWEDVITVVGLSTLPQVMWSTFLPFVPNTILPGTISFATALLAVVMARMGKLSEKAVKFLGMVSGWTATLLFMWMAVAQMWTNLLNPDNVKGLSAVSMLLAMTGNGLFIPRSLFIRDFMWFTGSSWGSIFYGWGNLVCLYCFNCITKEFFWASTLGFLAWIGLAFWKDKQAHGLSSPVASLKELVFGP